MTARDPIDFYDHLDPWEGPEGPRRVARFLWTDSESGEELSVEVCGGEGFVKRLESLGFRSLSGEETDDPRRSLRARRRARVSVLPRVSECSPNRTRRGA